ncbi:MAG TPA: peptide ABC transporter substrate-binding protein [Chloroflexota bacterium]|nr:peptide ABC transporter substrate-binding protein [Chloroflexota bacterium]
MARVIRLQLALSLIGAAIVAGLLSSLAYGASVRTAPDVGGAYVEGVTGQPKFLDPLLASTTDYPAQTLDALIFSGLVKEDASGQPQPDLAESWNISPDGKQYTFYLRTNARWQDGQPVTADDVLYTVGLIQAPDFPGNADLAAAWQGVQVTKLDAYTVQFQRSEPFAPFMDYATVGLLPAHILGQTAAKDLPSSNFNRDPVGSGPYQLKQLDLRSATLQVADAYYGAKPYISRVMLRFYKDDDSVLQALLRGEVQGDWHVDANQIKSLQGATNIHLYSAQQPSFSGLCFNLADPLMNQLPVRQAVAYGLNRTALNDGVLGGTGRLDDSPIAPSSWAFDSTLVPLTYDPGKAESVLDDAGWKAGPNGVRTKDGQNLAPVILTPDSADHVAMANAIARQLATIGMAATVQAVGFDGLVKDFLAPRNFQIALLDWDEPGSDPDPYPLWHSSQATADGLNFSGWKNPQADEQLEVGRKNTDMPTRKKAYSQFQALFQADLPAVLLFHPVYEYAVADSIQGVSLPASIHPWDRFATEAQWYIKSKPVSPLFG